MEYNYFGELMSCYCSLILCERSVVHCLAWKISTCVIIHIFISIEKITIKNNFEWITVMEISHGISLEGLMLKLKLQYFGHLMRRAGKDSDAGRDWGQEEKGMTEDEMAGCHHWLDGRESEWTLGVGDGQWGLACCDSWGHKESDTTEQLNWTELNWSTYSGKKMALTE